jgi:cobalt/nickel transport system permease protein
MHKIPYDLFIERNSPIHRLPGTVKLVTGLLLVIGIALTPRNSWDFYAVAACLLIVVAILARLPLKRIALRVLVFEPVIGGVALLSLLQPNGLHTFLGLIVKSTLCLCCMMVMAAVTPFTEFLTGLRRIRVPALMVTTLALMSRYLFLLADEMSRMHRARASRTFTTKRAKRGYLLSTIVAQLFARTSLRAERVYAAMCARGWRT